MNLRQPGKRPAYLGAQRGTKPTFILKAFKLGINFFDTANVYSGGASEEAVY